MMLIASSGCTSMTPGRLSAVQPESDRPRVGNVYLLRGWIGIFSHGINELGRELNAQGVRANVYQDDQWATLAEAIKCEYAGRGSAEPLILVGHSFGADDVLRVSRELAEEKIEVDLVVTLDPVTPPDVPPNVRRCVNLYQSNGAWDKVPAFRGVPLRLAGAAGRGGGNGTELRNMDIRKDRTDLLEPGTDHFNIEKKAKVHAEVIRQVLAVCPARGHWALQTKRGGGGGGGGASGGLAGAAMAAAARSGPASAVATTQPVQAVARPVALESPAGN
jgi:hypothetical protein